MRAWPLYILEEHLRCIESDREEILRRILMTATYRLKYNTNGGVLGRIVEQRIRARKVDVPLDKKDWEMCDWTYGRWSDDSGRLAQLLASIEVISELKKSGRRNVISP